MPVLNNRCAVARNSGGGIFTYRVGATTDREHSIYGTFAEALAAAQVARPSTILIDSLNGPGEVLAGAWDVDNIHLFGGDGYSGTLLIQDGATLTGNGLYVENVVLNQMGSAPFISLGGTSEKFLTLTVGSSIVCDAVPAIEVLDSASLLMVMRYFSYIYSSSGPVINTMEFAQTFIFTDIAVAIYPYTLDGTGTYLIDDLTGIAVDNQNQGLSHSHNATNITYAYG